MAKYNSSGFVEQHTNYRARKPPGGDTNDIFSLEVRQKAQRQDMLNVYQDETAKNKHTHGIETSKNHYETEDVPISLEKLNRNFRRSLSDCKAKLDELRRTPPLSLGKENIEVYKNLLSPKEALKGSDAVLLENLKDNEESKETADVAKISNRNPIIGENLKIGRSSRSQLRDATNQDKNETASQEEVPLKAPRRTCIRVTHPPGGKSSITF